MKKMEIQKQIELDKFREEFCLKIKEQEEELEKQKELIEDKSHLKDKSFLDAMALLDDD